MNKIAVIAFLVFATGSLHQAFGQQKKAEASDYLPHSGFLIGVHGSLPAGDFKDAYNWGAGGYIEYDRGIARNLSAYLQGSYAYFLGKKEPVDNPNAGAFTGIVGLKYIVSNKIDFGIGAGYGHFFGKYQYVSEDGSAVNAHFGLGGLAVEPFVSYYITSKTILNLSYRSFSLHDDDESSREVTVSYFSLGLGFML